MNTVYIAFVDYEDGSVILSVHTRKASAELAIRKAQDANVPDLQHGYYVEEHKVRS